MFLVLKNLLSPEELEQIRAIARSVRFVDGRVSNPHNLAKKNLQADTTMPDTNRAAQIAGAALNRNEAFQNFAFPRRVASPLLARYEPGMTYGAHADAPYLPLPNGPLRSDVSATIWIADPETYDGGELRIHLGSENVTVKGEPGSVVLYPSTTLHEVVPVTRGQRVVMFTFIESFIPNQLHRELLYTLNEVSALEGFNMSWENRTRLNFVSSSLNRLWAG